MTKYTPSEEYMRYLYGGWAEEFDRFLARVRRDAAREALDGLAAAEHRATRAEAQSAIRGRAVVIYRDRAREAEAERDEWRQTALDERAAALDALEQIKVRDARIKAVRDIHTPEKHSSRDGDGAVCQECLYGDGYSVKYPCPTIRALESDPPPGQ